MDSYGYRRNKVKDVIDLDNDSMNGLAKGLLVFGIILLIGIVGGEKEPKHTCFKSGCNNEQASGSSSCYLHKPYAGGSSNTKKNSNSSTYSSGGKTNSTGGSSSSKKTTNKYSSEKKTYNALNCDPDDYDSPEDYADDAWGDDFDDWDDAYDYWENY